MYIIKIHVDPTFDLIFFKVRHDNDASVVHGALLEKRLPKNKMAGKIKSFPKQSIYLHCNLPFVDIHTHNWSIPKYEYKEMFCNVPRV